MSRAARPTRRELLLAAALLAAGCGGSSPPSPAAHGSTLHGTFADLDGSGILRPAPGEPLRPRAELGRPVTSRAVLATLAHVTDAHVLDAQSPARVPFLDRLGPPFQSTFRPQETLTTQVLAGALRAVRALSPDAVIQGGDLIDNAQANELHSALTVLAGGLVRPGSGSRGGGGRGGGGHYVGVQSPADPDPFYYRPDLDAPRHPGLLDRATRPFTATGLHRPWLPVLGDHDVLVAGEIAPTPLTRALALGDRAIWDLPPNLTLPPGLKASGSAGGAAAAATLSPDGPPDPALVDTFLREALQAPKVRVPPDPRRRELAAGEVTTELQAASGRRSRAGGAGRLDYRVDLGARVRLLVLDLAQRAGGSGGFVVPDQPGWVARELATAGERWILVVSHQPLLGSAGGDEILALLDRDPRVVAALNGHVHRNRIEARSTPAGGYWLIGTASLIDYPQQARALRLVETARGGVAIQTWMLDHVGPGNLGAISRQLSYLDAQGGRPEGFAGGRLDRNVTLYRD